MAYATFNDVITRYRPIQTMVGTAEYGVTSDEVCSVFIWQAEAYVDAWLGQRYVVPFAAPTPPLVTMIAADLAIYYMLAEKTPAVPEFIAERKKRADELLQKLVEGKMTIGSVSVVTSAGDNFAWSSNMGYTPVFSPVLGDLDQRESRERVISEKDARGLNNDNCS